MSTGARRRYGLATRLLLAQVVVLLASLLTAGLVALLLGPSLFHAHVLQVRPVWDPAELEHIEQGFRDASFVALSAGLLISLACAVGVTWWLTRGMQRTLDALTTAAAEVSRGHLSARVASAGGGAELDTLAGAFNLMAGQLEQTEATRRRLLSDLAHELRTPISTIQLCCEGLSDGVLQWDEGTERILTEHTARLARLAGDIDEVSRAEEGRLELNLAPVRAKDLVSSAVQRQADAFARAGVRLTGEYGSAGDAIVQVDADRLGQVMDNVLRNAVRHTPPGGTVVVSAARAGEEVHLIVTDSGDGIPAEHLGHVFERFYRGDTARDRDHGGSGIGLTISRAIADAHGGSLTASSAGPGHGSTFTLRLPLLTRQHSLREEGASPS
ncbi:HAMP domain-containing sensor histidine kinase [Ornithinimicrobium cerasi]|uniref:HAMP domain-containing sensor histidine kinase n=1 Tax=Ornithinimicrobium cerasi TaxID=2248773 RepID=UPI000EFDEB61|nr:HAMP domain-containing sensor histidine kinase [Ornithinimicrobium cerasi]